MPRIVEGPAPGQVERYVPDVKIGEWSNRDDNEPVVVVLRNPTRADVRAWLSDNRRIKSILDKDHNVVGTEIDGKIDDDGWRLNALRRFVDKIEGYTCNGEKIVDGETLWQHGESPFVYDVSDRIRNGLSLEKKQPKPSAEPTDSAPAATPASDGTADNAA